MPGIDSINPLYRPQADFAQLRVLIVDRHSNARDVLRQMLSTLGITRIHGAGSSAEVLRQVRSNRFDIIFSDYQLEDGRDGQQLLEELRGQNLLSRATVFIVVTSERSARNVVSVAELTPDDYLIKPFTSDQLLSRLGRALFRKQSFARALQHFEAGAYQKALAVCDEALQKGSEFTTDTLRLKGEVFIALGRYAEAEQLFHEILTVRPLPWARLGLAEALRGQQRLAEALKVAKAVVDAHPHYMAARDFYGRSLAEAGQLVEALATLAAAAALSPHNTQRQRQVGEIAQRNGDLETAELAYQTVLRRSRGSSLVSVEDYTNLSRVFLDQGKVAQARTVALDLRRERRHDPVSEVAAAITESLCFRKEGDAAKAQAALDEALATRQNLPGEAEGLPEKIAVDLADACFGSGRGEEAKEILRQVAYQNPDDAALQDQIALVFERGGDQAAGRALIEQVAREVGGARDAHAEATRSGDLAGSLDALCRHADRIPNVQFLVNAANAVFGLIDQRGWKNDLAEHGLRYLLRAQAKDPKNPKVVAANDLFQNVAQKYGVSVAGFRQQVVEK